MQAFTVLPRHFCGAATRWPFEFQKRVAPRPVRFILTLIVEGYISEVFTQGTYLVLTCSAGRGFPKSFSAF